MKEQKRMPGGYVAPHPKINRPAIEKPQILKEYTREGTRYYLVSGSDKPYDADTYDRIFNTTRLQIKNRTVAQGTELKNRHKY